MSKTTRQRLEWECHVCGFPVADGTGHLSIDLSEATTAEALERDWRERHRDEIGHTLAELLTLPEVARWVVAHDKCRPLPDGPYYCIDIERATTAAHLLNWTAHLMGKTWLSATNWDDLIREMSGVDA